MGGVRYDPGPTSHGPELIKIEASQKGWFLVRALARALGAITHVVADIPHDWESYYEAKKETLHSFEQFEQWYGKSER